MPQQQHLNNGSCRHIVSGIAKLFPYTPFATYFGLVPLSGFFMFFLVGITLFYLLISELAKQILFASLEKNNRSGA
jgi:hypothetical protein